MRNCYVYKCDWKHRNNPKRAMFILPKDPAKFKQWSEALPKHRRLTHHDRVCEKHFKPEDILRDWTHLIKGETKKVQRSKPNLRPDAIPCIFDLSQADLKTMSSKREKHGRRDCSEVEYTSFHISFDDLQPSGCDQNETDTDAIFEDIYDNIFEVELPSTLWGVHRDPERKYIAFTRFQMLGTANSTTSTTLLLESSLTCCAWCDSSVVYEDDLFKKMTSQQNSDKECTRYQFISNILDSLEQYSTGDE